MEMHRINCALEPGLSDLFGFIHAPRLGLWPCHHGLFFFFSSKVERRHLGLITAERSSI